MRHHHLLDSSDSLLLVVDLQEAFAPHVQNFTAVVERCCTVIQAAKVLNLPVVVTEQYPKGLGRTVEPVRNALGDCRYYDKLTFSGCQDPAVLDAVLKPQRRQIILIGIETHVCIAQTAFDVLAVGRQPYILADAVGSRHAIDHQTALARLQSAGAVITTAEAAIMEMTFSSRHEHFKAISKLIK
jgi:nicotinamidase-related amidase